MRVLFLLITIGLSSAYANSSYAQTKMDINVNNLTLEELFMEIQEKSEFVFFFKDELLSKNDKRITLNLKKALLSTILDKALSNTNLSYKIDDRQVIIKALPKTSLTPIDKQAKQEFEVSGRILDESDQPLPGANILEKGTSNGTLTDFDGNFTLTVTDENAVLIISYLGFLTQEINVNNQTTVNITLQEDAAKLDEVVVVGYGTQKKVNLTGSVASISSKDIENRPVANVSTLLAGQISGLAVIQKSGRPGSNGGTLRIRGIGTLGNSNPLVMVDGVEADLQDVDVNDIENISVLKDASSAAIYGVRAANGVILVTTKSGRLGAPVITYHGGFGTQEPFKTPERVGAYDYARLFNQAQINDGTAVRYSEDDLNKWKNGTSPQTHPDLNHYQELINSGNPARTFHNISVSGGTEATKYHIGLGYMDEGSLINSFGYNRKNYRINVNQKISDKLDVGVRLSGSFAEQKGNSQSVGQLITEAYRGHPGDISQFENGLWSVMQTWNGGSGRNMLAYVNAPLGHNNYSYNDYISTFHAEYKFNSDLKLRGQFSARNDNSIQDSFRNNLLLYRYDATNDIYNVGTDISGGIINKSNTTWDLTSNLILTYQKTFDKHNVSMLLGFEQKERTWAYIEASRFSIRGSNELTELNGVSSTIDNANGNSSDYRLRSGFSRLKYNFDEKYLFEANLRYDGTSRFPKSNRFAFFPSFSAKWKLSEEEFFKSEVFDNLALKASWGQLGNQEIGEYAFLNVFGSVHNYAFGNATYNGINEKSPLANEEITWETTTMTNVGIEAKLFENTLTVGADYFIKETDDILLSLPQPSILGANPPIINAGSVENKGFDVSLNYKNTIGDNFSYYTNANVSYVKNKITDLKDTDSPGRSVGDPIQNIFGFATDGLFNSDAEATFAPDQSFFGGISRAGDIRYVDINGRDANGELTGMPDGVVNADDRKSLGTFFPKYSFGFNAGFNWKNLDFSMSWQGFAGNKALTSGPSIQPFWSASTPTKDMVDNFWTPQNTNADFPRLTFQNQGRNYQASTYWLNNGAFAKLRNLQVGYNLSDNVLETLKVKKIRIYVSGENLLHISGFKDIDPEFAHGNPFAWNDSNYPSSRQYQIGVNVTF